MKLTGVDGVTEEVKLTHPADDPAPFTIGKTSNLTFTAGDVGALSYIEVRCFACIVSFCGSDKPYCHAVLLGMWQLSATWRCAIAAMCVCVHP